jgi:hypothetical protein
VDAGNVGQHYDRWRYEQLGRPVQPAGVYELATFSSVVDGDIIDVTFPDGRTARDRLIGVDAPEIHGQVECYGEAASAFTRSWLLGKEMWLEKDVSAPNRYKRLLCYVWVGPYLLNEILVRQGYAGVTTYPPDVKYEWRRAGGSRGAGWSLVGVSRATGGRQAGTAPCTVAFAFAATVPHLHRARRRSRTATRPIRPSAFRDLRRISTLAMSPTGGSRFAYPTRTASTRITTGSAANPAEAALRAGIRTAATRCTARCAGQVARRVLTVPVRNCHDHSTTQLVPAGVPVHTGDSITFDPFDLLTTSCTVHRVPSEVARNRMDSFETLLVASLLHDLGKLWQRTGQRHSAAYDDIDSATTRAHGAHARLSADALLTFLPMWAEAEPVVLRHHNTHDRLTRLVALADQLSTNERNDSKPDQPAERQGDGVLLASSCPGQRQLVSFFTRISLSGRETPAWYWPVRPLMLEPEIIFP